MFYVTTLGGQVEPLINIGTDFKTEQSTDGTFTISFSTFPESNPGYELLKSESIVTVEGNDFRVKQISQNSYSKSVVAVNTFFDLSKKQIQQQMNGVKTLSERIAFALNGTGWTYTIDDAIAGKSVLINSFGKTNIIAMIESICKYYECEYIINGSNVHFASQIGSDNDYQYRYKHNVASVVMKEDTTNLYTKITGYGADGLMVTYTSPNAAVFGELEAEPIEDDRYTNASSLLAYIKQQIRDVPELAIETSIPELTQRETGERIWLIYEPLGIEMQTRILKQTKTLRNGELITSSVVLGNSQIKTVTDYFIDQKQDLNETNEQVNVVKEGVKETKASIVVLDDRIDLAVENINGNRASISVLENEIELKVDSNGIISAINLSPEAVTISASKINLNGAVLVNGTITGSSTLNITSDIYVGNNIYLAQNSNSVKGIVFDGVSRITGTQSYISISAPEVEIGTYTTFSGIVDFSAATVVGLPKS